jgi:hypothetical protein
LIANRLLETKLGLPKNLNGLVFEEILKNAPKVGPD